VLLIERRERKVAFLERLVRSIPLPNVEVFGGGLAVAARNGSGTFLAGGQRR
jgi:16S rRNA G527 N7-methylase RsmG